jgi:hypothetical protein
VPGFVSSTAVALGNGSYGGSYTVAVPGRYSLPVTLDGGVIANSPFELVYLAPTPCLSPLNTTVPTFMASPPLSVCGEYGSNGCCDAALVATLNAHWAYLAATFGAFPPSQCTRQLEILACGMACSPRNLGFVDRSGQCSGNSTNSSLPGNGTTCDSSVLVCTTFCDDIWNACSNVVPAGSSSTVAVIYGGNRLAFCSAQFPPQYLGQPVAPVFNTTTNSSCFFGLLREPACSNTSYVTDRKPLVAGVASFVTIVAQDCFGNPRISGGDTFVVAAPPGVLIGPLVDNGDGTYTVPITAFRACLDACVRVNVTVAGQGEVQNAPFGLNVVPNCPHGPSSVFTPITQGTLPPFRFDFVAYDEWLNLAYNAAEADFAAVLSDASGVGPSVSLQVVSLGCNGSFAVQVEDNSGLLNASECRRFCLDAICRPQSTTTRVTCANLCNQTSYIFFSDTGARIDAKLVQNISVIPPQFFGEFDCCLLIKNCELLGAGAYCVIRNRTDVQIFLPYNAPVCSSGTSTCDPDLANLYFDCTPLNVTGGACSVPVVTQRLSPNANPVVRLIAPDAFVRCAGLNVSGAGSTNAGGRAGRWRWDLVAPFSAGDNHDAINAYLATVGTASNVLQISSATAAALFVEGATYHLRATLINHLDQAGSAIVTFTVRPDSQSFPVLFVCPAAPVAPAVMQQLGFHALVSFPGCLSAGAPEEVAVPVAWVMPLSPPQLPYQFLANRTVNQNSLELPEDTLPQLSAASVFEVWALGANPISAQRVVMPVPRAPYAYAAYGTTRLFVLGDGNLRLAAPETFEWNQPSNNTLSIAWSCETDTGAPCFDPLQTAALLPPRFAIQIPPTAFGLGLYVFHASVASALGGGPTVLTVTILTNGTAPDVTLDWFTPAIRNGNAPSDTVSLLATVERDVRFGVMETVWETDSGNAVAPTTLPGLPEGAALPPGSTGSDATYEVRVSARDSEGEGYAKYEWVANDRPNGGNCSVADNGAGLLMLRCSNWEDRQSDPLSYELSFAAPDNPSVLLPLSFGRWFCPMLPFEVLSAPFTYALRLTVVDQTGHGRTAVPLPPVIRPGVFPACPETAASTLATATLQHQEALDSPRLMQRAVSVCSLLRSAVGCDASLRSAVFSQVLTIVSCVVRSEPSRARSVLAANTVAYCLDGAPLSVSLSQFQRVVALLSRLGQTAEQTFRQEGLRSQPVAQAIVSALDISLQSRTPVFDAVAPDAADSASVLALLEQQARALAADLRAGEPGPSARSARLAVSAFPPGRLRPTIRSFRRTRWCSPLHGRCSFRDQPRVSQSWSLPSVACLCAVRRWARMETGTRARVRMLWQSTPPMLRVCASPTRNFSQRCPWRCLPTVLRWLLLSRVRWERRLRCRWCRRCRQGWRWGRCLFWLWPHWLRIWRCAEPHDHREHLSCGSALEWLPVIAFQLTIGCACRCLRSLWERARRSERRGSWPQ